MTQKKENELKQENSITGGHEATELKSNLSYDDKVIRKIAAMAAEEVDGLLTLTGGFMGQVADRFKDVMKSTKGIEAQVGKKQVALDFSVVCEYGKNIPKMFDEVSEKVSKVMKETTGLELVELNMHVNDILKPDEFEALLYSRQENKEKTTAKKLVE